MIGVVTLARPTFDVPYAAARAEAAFSRLAAVASEMTGGPQLLMDAAAVDTAVAGFRDDLDAVVVLQASFADSTLVARVADQIDAPLVLWAFTEPRTGGRLRINSFCGINLAGFALAATGHDYRYVYRDAEDPALDDELRAAIAGPGIESRGRRSARGSGSNAAELVADLEQARIGLVGRHPDGFEPCAYDPDALRGLAGTAVDEASLDELFAAGRAADTAEVAGVRDRVAALLEGIDDVDQESLDASLRIHLGLRTLIDQRSWSGVATRCWPECFTEFGGAACTAQSLLNLDGYPGCCEADVYGNLTSLALQYITGEPSFVADLVDVDRSDNTGVMWHCGLAPTTMAAPEATPAAALHSNRRKPLLNEFPLKQGRVTIARVSQARGEHALVIGGGEMLDAPMAFSGTSGVVKFDSPAGHVVETIMAEGLEHHYGIAYGEHRDSLEDLATAWDIPVIDL